MKEPGYLNKSMQISRTISSDYRELHKIPETGFNLDKTVSYVKKRLSELDIGYTECGKNGISAVIGKQDSGKCILLRADMDALPVKEESEVDFKSENGNMHACGHDMHTAMLLGAAKLLKEREKLLKGCVKLLFQPAEEILEGAKNMVENGILENPEVNAAVMLHVLVGGELESGCIIIPAGGVSAPAADYFKINLKGQGCHGSTPEKGRDPLSAACRTVIALDEIKAKELSLSERAVITVGKIQAGNASNVIPDTAEITGTLRAYNENTREYIKKRLIKISGAISSAFEVDSDVIFEYGCPSLYNDPEFSEKAERHAKEILPDNMVRTAKELLAEMEKKGEKDYGAGSEDFAYISRKVPSLMVAVSAGKASEGYSYPLHHPKVIFDEKALPYGSAFLAGIAEMWQNELK